MESKISIIYIYLSDKFGPSDIFAMKLSVISANLLFLIFLDQTFRSFWVCIKATFSGIIFSSVLKTCIGNKLLCVKVLKKDFLSGHQSSTSYLLKIKIICNVKQNYLLFFIFSLFVFLLFRSYLVLYNMVRISSLGRVDTFPACDCKMIAKYCKIIFNFYIYRFF